MKKLILILGSEGRLGKCFCEYLSNIKNYTVIGLDIKKSSENKKYKTFKLNINNEKILKNYINKIRKVHGSIHTVINCTYPSIKSWGLDFNRVKKKQLDNHFSKHLSDLIISTRCFTQVFLKQKFGNVIFISSIQGLGAPKFEHYKGTKMNSCIEYSIIKAGIINMTKYLAKFHKGKNIRFNCISIGGIKADQPKIFKENYKKSCLNKGLLDPADILSAFDFLISDKSSYVNGQNIIIDDGWSL